MQNRPWSWKESGLKEALFVVVFLALWMGFELGAGHLWLSTISSTTLATISAPMVKVLGIYQQPLRPLVQWWHQTDQIKQLTLMLADAESRLASLESVSQENARLRELLENRHLDLRERRIGQTVASYAIPSVWLGEDTEVQPGALVMYKNILLGRIASVESGLGKVELVAQSDQLRILAKVENGATGVTRGDLGRLLVEKLPPDVVVQPGQQVVTVGQPGVPPGLLIGMTASSVEYSNGQGQVVVNQLISFYETSLVEIIPL